MENFKTEVRDGLRIDWDVPVKMEDGLVLRADVYRPLDESKKYPVVLTYGPYGKGLAFQDGYKAAWDQMVRNYPDVAAGSSNKYQNWETVDPEKWVPDGYVCVRVDSRGCGRSPGYVDHYSPRETKDFYNCIEWCAVQPWSDGKIGLNGISYYAINQWEVASLQPPHLTAMCIWEGASEWYRDMTHHGGIVCTFWAHWQDSQVKSVQYGLGERGKRSWVTGELVSGPETLSQQELDRNRCKLGDEIVAHPLDDSYHADRSPVYEKIKTPFLSTGNWGGQGLHLRGNVEGFVNAASSQKWLELHGREHWTEFYTDYGVGLQKRFFDYFLKGKRNGWDSEPHVQLMVRHVDKFVPRGENEWPLARTQWTKFYLDPDDMSLSDKPVQSEKKLEYETIKEGLTFTSAPLKDGNGIHWTECCEAFCLIGHKGCRCFCHLPRVRAGRKGSRVSGRDRSAHAGRARMAARFASQTRSRQEQAVSSLSHDMTRYNRLRPASPLSWMWRSGPPALSCRRVIVSRLRCAEATTNILAQE